MRHVIEQVREKITYWGAVLESQPGRRLERVADSVEPVQRLVDEVMDELEMALTETERRAPTKQ